MVESCSSCQVYGVLVALGASTLQALGLQLWKLHLLRRQRSAEAEAELRKVQCRRLPPALQSGVNLSILRRYVMQMSDWEAAFLYSDPRLTRREPAAVRRAQIQSAPISTSGTQQITAAKSLSAQPLDRPRRTIERRLITHLKDVERASRKGRRTQQGTQETRRAKRRSARSKERRPGLVCPRCSTGVSSTERGLRAVWCLRSETGEIS